MAERKNARRNNKAAILWKLVRSQEDFSNIITEARKRLGIPEDGFASTTDMFSWSLTKGRSQRAEKAYRYLFDETKKLLPKDYRFAFYGFTGLLTSYVWHNRRYWDIFDESNLSMINVSGIFIRIVSPSQCTVSPNEYGLYIRIDPRTQMKDLKDYITYGTKDIREIQKELLDELRTPSRRRIRAARNTERDKLVYTLSRLPKSELSKMVKDEDKHTKYKNTLIAKMVGNLTTDNVRRIINEQSKMHRRAE